jgi:hypothetical protein
VKPQRSAKSTVTGRRSASPSVLDGTTSVLGFGAGWTLPEIDAPHLGQKAKSG